MSGRLICKCEAIDRVGKKTEGGTVITDDTVQDVAQVASKTDRDTSGRDTRWRRRLYYDRQVIVKWA
jgi:hypothetical protein